MLEHSKMNGLETEKWQYFRIVYFCLAEKIPRFSKYVCPAEPPLTHTLLLKLQKYKDTIRCLALGAEVAGYCPGQISQTLIVCLLKRLWVLVNQNLSQWFPLPPLWPPEQNRPGASWEFRTHNALLGANYPATHTSHMIARLLPPPHQHFVIVPTKKDWLIFA